MTKNRGNVQNLKAPLSPEEARKFGSKGGKKSVEVRRAKKLLSALYADMLASEYGLAGKGLTLAQVVSVILARCDSSSVSMLKEIREATEGNKIEHTGSIIQIIDNVPKPKKKKCLA